MTVYYWQGVLGAEENLDAYSETINKLLTGNYQAADLDLKKLENHRIFSVRVNHTDRLLFTTIMVENKPYLLLLEVILNHDYQKSRFLKPSVLSQYLDRHSAELAQQIINEQSFTKTDIKPVINETHAHNNYLPANLYDQKFIVLNSAQQGVLEAPLPVVVSGGPGSGKSCVAISLLEQCLQSSTDSEDTRPILYVTQSERLAATMQRIWADLPKTDGHPANVQFKSYTQLLQETEPDAFAAKQQVGYPEFQTWLKNYINAQKKLRKTNVASIPDDDFFAQTQLINQEFRLISGFNPDEYRKLGQKQCHFYEKIEKEWLLGAFKAYQQHLDENKLLHPAFFPLNKKDIYSAIVVDEAQDLSNGQLLALLELSSNFQTCFLMDSHQSLSDILSKRTYLLEKLFELGYDLSHIELPFSYRCPEKITEIANEVIKLKIRLTGGLVDKFEAGGIQHSEHHEDAGNVRWFNNFSDEEKAHFREAAQSVNVAIVTPPEFKEEARKLFNSPLVFSTEEIKGLEYPTIIAYRLFDTPIYKEANSLLAKGEGSSSTQHRAKKGQGDDKFGPPFNNIFTAFTRAMRELIIVQPKSHAIAEIVNHLQKPEVNKISSSDMSGPSTAPASTKADWQREALRQEELGNTAQAKAIRDEKLSEVQESPKGKGKGKKKGKGKGKKKINKSETVNAVPIAKKEEEKTALPARPAAAASLNQAKPVDVAERNARYVRGLLADFTYANLTKLFAAKNPEKWLFDIPIDSYPSLMQGLMIENKIQVLLDFLLSSNPYRSLCVSTRQLGAPAEKRLPLFFYFNTSEPGRVLLALILRDNPRIIYEIPQLALFSRVSTQSGNCRQTSAFFWLCVSAQTGHIILKELFEKNEKLFQGEYIADELCFCPPDGDGYSSLIGLCGTPTGREVLTLMLTKNRSIAEGIRAEDLDHPIYQLNKEGRKVPVTARSILKRTHDGKNILSLIPSALFEKEPSPSVSSGFFATKTQEPASGSAEIEKNEEPGEEKRPM